MADMPDRPARPSVQSLPTDPVEWQKRNTLKRPKNLNDEIDAIVSNLMATDPKFQKFLEPAYPEDSIHGDLFFDDIELARIVLAHAQKPETKNVMVANTKLKGIHRAVQVVLRRYEATRKQRRMEAENGHFDEGPEVA